jgi:hypothetical protein
MRTEGSVLKDKGNERVMVEHPWGYNRPVRDLDFIT